MASPRQLKFILVNGVPVELPNGDWLDFSPTPLYTVSVPLAKAFGTSPRLMASDPASGLVSQICNHGADRRPALYQKRAAVCFSSAALTAPDDEYLAADPDLWRLGVRPSSQEPATSVHRHLDDMRQIAFKALNLPKPEDD